MSHRSYIFLFLILVITAVGRAHDPGLSAAAIQVQDRRILAVLTFARADIETITTLDTNHDGQVTPEEFGAARFRLQGLARAALEVQLDSQTLSAPTVKVDFDESNAIHFRLSFPVESGSRINIRSKLLGSLALGHRQYVVCRDSRGNLLSERVLAANSDNFELSARQQSPAENSGSFRHFLALGVEHIVTGYDHLVFLLGLLLAGGTLISAAKIITSFTVAHSITLALATLGWVEVSPAVVEPLIAISILYVGLENIFRRDLNRRWLLTFGFGLIHGFGFATVLRDMGIGSSHGGVAVPLLSFNLGVELGQVVIAALALPLIWGLRRHPSYATRFAPACSVMIALAGGYWLVLRTLLG